MIYKKFKGLDISTIAFGAMRLPVIDGDEGRPDVQATQKLVDLCMSRGVNYYDTAWGYHNGKSQEVLGECLSHYRREDYLLANKFPGYDLENMPKAEEIFKEQLRLCKVDYFDFYLIHNVCELNIDAYVDPKYGIRDYFLRMLKEGRIRHLGFSLHGGMDVLRRFDEAYGDVMEFCMLQVNLVDWEFQNAREKVEFCRNRGWPIFVMEPLRGGKIAKMSPEQLSRANGQGRQRTAVEWGFNFVQAIPGVVTVLSGMTEIHQVEEKLEVFDHPVPLNAEEFDTALALGRELTSVTSIPCTSCRYCTSKCPKGLDIPLLISRYNEMLYNHDGFEFLSHMAMAATDKSKWPTACIACGACSKVCPQVLDIPKIMKDFDKALQS